MGTYKASIYNYLFNSINAIIVIINGIVMVPIYFHYMSVSTYGAWLATGNIVAMLGLLESGFSSVITQKMSSAISQHDDNRYSLLAGANIITATVIAIAILFVGFSISPFITDWINADAEIQSDIRLAYIVALVSSCIALMVSLFGAFPQVWQDTKVVGIINTVTGLVAIASLVLFLLIGFGVVSIALSYLVRALLNLLCQGSWIIKKWRREDIAKPLFSFSESKQLAKDCIYPFLSKISGVLMGNTQSFIIAHFMNPTLAAMYDLTAKCCFVACGFVSQMNGSFFALFSLTLSSGDKSKIESIFKTTTQLFILSLALVSLYSICFTEPVINYWVGLDKYGGTWLLIIIVLAKILFQFRAYCNTILYTGGLINRSARLDILCAITYVAVLLAIIKPTQVYAIPLATLAVSILFIMWYLMLMNKHLGLNVQMMAKELLFALLYLVPFILIHYLLSLDYHNLPLYIAYFVVFTIVYLVVLYFTNKQFIKQVVAKFKR